jgi:tRNA (cmo5U34)-methyltransferase
MSNPADTNSEIWKSDEVVKEWVAQSSDRDRQRIAHWQILGKLLPYEENDPFTFLDLGAGTGAATRTLFELYPRSEAVLAEYSPQMIAEGERALAPY